MANEPQDVLATIEAERLKYGTPMTSEECVNLLNSVADQHRNQDGSPCWVQNFKDWGEGWARRYDGQTLSEDTLIHLPTYHIYDCLGSAPVVASPQMNDLGQHTQSDRYPVDPIEARDPSEPPVVQTTQLGATCFSLLDLYLHDRPRGERWMQHLRDDMGATFLRAVWRKGTGDEGDYWNNVGGSFSCVQEDPDPAQMQLCMQWAYEHGFTIAHCVFGDTLAKGGGYLSPDQQRRRVDNFLAAVTPIPQVSAYYEVHNEPYTRGDGHGGNAGHGGCIEDLQWCARYLRNALGPVPLIALGTPQQLHMGGNDLENEIRDMYAGCPEANMITAHFPRGNPDGSVNNNPQTCPDLTTFAPSPRSNGEPIGPDSSVAETKDANALAENFRYTQQSGYGWYVYHDDYLIRPRANDMYARPEWPDISAALMNVSGGTSGGGGGTPTPKPPAEKDTLQPGEELKPGESLWSANKRFQFYFQHDCNAVIHDHDCNVVVWASDTAGHEPLAFAMQADGALVLYEKGGDPVWAQVFDAPGSIFTMQNEGNGVLYGPPDAEGGRSANWATSGGVVSEGLR